MRPSLTLAALLPLLCACGDRGESPAVSEAEARPARELAGLVLVADSPQTLLAWSQATPAERREHPGMLEGVVYGQKAFVRAAVTGYDPAPPGEDDITGSLRLHAPDGSVLHSEQVGTSAADLDATAPGVSILRPGIDVLFDPGDPVGTYVIEADLHRGRRRLKLTQPLLVEAGGAFLPPPGEETP
ncbi:MAG: hypothetical protein ABIO70_05320 [Pseudomonadota bacterium]